MISVGIKGMHHHSLAVFSIFKYYLKLDKVAHTCVPSIPESEFVGSSQGKGQLGPLGKIQASLGYSI